MYCWHHQCPYYNFENGPFHPTEEDKARVINEFDCDDIRFRICVSTTPEGHVTDEQALREQYKRECTIMEGVEAYE